MGMKKRKNKREKWRNRDVRRRRERGEGKRRTREREKGGREREVPISSGVKQRQDMESNETLLDLTTFASILKSSNNNQPLGKNCDIIRS